MKKPLQEMLMKLKSVFPDAVTETQRTDEDGKPFYVYALKEEFIELLQDNELDIADDQNRYELQFPGKSAAKAQAFVPSYKTLVADKEQSKNFDETGNVFIEGDNLDALRMLQRSYRGKIKVIYIDPPYNTGGDDFVYNDDFSVRQRAYLEAAGVLDEEGVKQISEIQNGLRGRFHAGWLAMMYPRLKLARELLSKDGVIFISIDDNEQANLRLICDEIFGESNFLANICWWSKYTLSNDAKTISYQHENILFYAKSYNQFDIGLLPRTDEMDKSYKNPDNDINGPWKATPLHAKSGRDSDRYSITFPNGIEWECPAGRYPRYAREKLLSIYNSGGLYFGKDGRSKPNRKTYLSEVKQGKTVGSLWSYADVGSSHESNEEISSVLGKGVFDNPKGTRLIKQILRVANIDADGIILDFFAGSGTTAHAVMQLNAEDNGNRKFIMVQWAEKIDSQKSEDAHKFCTEELNRPTTIAEIAKERIRRAGDKIRTDNPDKQTDDGFRVYTVQDSLLTDSSSEKFTAMDQPALSGLKTDLAAEKFEPLLYEAILETGVTLDLPITKREIDGYPFAVCNRRCYCVTEGLTQTIVRKIVEQFGDKFDTFHYLSDCPTADTSYTELKSAIQLAPGDKKIKPLNFY